MSEASSAMNSRRYLPTFLILAAMQVGGALLLTFARVQGMIDGETATRGVMALIGLGMVGYGNLIPKMLEGPPRTVRETMTAQAVLRFSGWSLTLAGIIWSALWIFAPRDVALFAGVSVVALSIVATIGYTILRYRAGRASGVG